LREQVRTKAETADVSADLLAVTAAVNGIKGVIGKNQEGVHKDLWSFSSATDSSLQQLFDKQLELESQQASVFAKILALEGKGQVNETRWDQFSKRYVPLVVEQDRRISQVEADQQLPRPVAASAPPQVFPPPSRPSPELVQFTSEIRAWKEGVSQELREALDKMSVMGSDRSAGASYGKFHFADPEAAAKFLKGVSSIPTHGPFVDIVSFLEMFGAELYVDRHDTMSDLHLSSKVGHSTLTDAIVSSSFQNVLPLVFARVSNSRQVNSGNTDQMMDVMNELPGVPTPSSWDKRNGVNGKKYWMTTESKKTYTTIQRLIKARLTGEGQELANLLLTDSLLMAESLISFMGTSFEDTTNARRFDESQAWELTCKFVKRVVRSPMQGLPQGIVWIHMTLGLCQEHICSTP